MSQIFFIISQKIKADWLDFSYNLVSLNCDRKCYLYFGEYKEHLDQGNIFVTFLGDDSNKCLWNYKITQLLFLYGWMEVIENLQTFAERERCQNQTSPNKEGRRVQILVILWYRNNWMSPTGTTESSKVFLSANSCLQNLSFLVWINVIQIFSLPLFVTYMKVKTQFTAPATYQKYFISFWKHH